MWTKKYQLGERKVEEISGQRNTSWERGRWRTLVDKEITAGRERERGGGR